MATNQSLDLLTAKTTPTGSDVLYLLDVADTTQSAAGSSKSLTIGNLLTYINNNATFPVTASNIVTFTNKTFDTAGTGNVFKINGTAISTITGTGAVVLATSPTLVTPTLGVATATTINKLTITAPATGSTLTITNGKTLTINNSLTFAGTDATTMTFPSSSDTVVTLGATQTMTNKRRTRRVVATTQAATPAINTDNTDVSSITGLAQAITSFTTSLTGTPVVGDLLEIQITDNGTARAITWGTSFEATTVALPTTTVISTMLRVLFEWNTVASKWDCIAVA